MGVPQLPGGQQPGGGPWEFQPPAGALVIGYSGRAGPHVGSVRFYYAAAPTTPQHAAQGGGHQAGEQQGKAGSSGNSRPGGGP